MAQGQRRVALVTGSSRGLGAVIARRLARDGFAVAVNGRPGDEGVAAVSRAIRDDGGMAGEFPADVTDEPQVAGLAAAIIDRLGPVDVLVVNATGSQPEAPVTEVGWAEHLAQLDFFVKSPVLLGRVLLPVMQARRYGRIVHIDSEVAHRPPPGRSAYAAAKNAQLGLTLSWARELAPFGITVNTVAPGFIPVERHAGVPDATIPGVARDLFRGVSPHDDSVARRSRIKSRTCPTGDTTGVIMGQDPPESERRQMLTPRAGLAGWPPGRRSGPDPAPAPTAVLTRATSSPSAPPAARPGGSTGRIRPAGRKRGPPGYRILPASHLLPAMPGRGGSAGTWSSRVPMTTSREATTR